MSVTLASSPPTCTFTPETSLKTITTEIQMKSSPIQGKEQYKTSGFRKSKGKQTIYHYRHENRSKNENPRTQQKGMSQTSKLHKPALNETVVPNIEWRNSEVMVNERAHKIPTTKEYLLKEFADIFQGVGSLPGPPYHIRLKKNTLQYNIHHILSLW